MKTDFMLAWRNLWRNKRRTFITVASIFFGVVLSTFMTSMQEGSYDKMVENAVRFYSGHIQIHNEDYWENKTINNTFYRSYSLEGIVKSTEGLELVVPRLESFALASSEQLTKGTMVLGIEPESEDGLTNLKQKIIRGKYLVQEDRGVLMGESLAKYLQVDVNDTLVLLSQGYHGVNAAGLFPVIGIIKHPSPSLDKQIVYMALAEAQNFYSADNLLTSMAITVDDIDDLPLVIDNLKSKVNKPYSVMGWEEMQPELVQQINGDREGGVIIKIVLFIVIGFGVFGTVIMMVAERRREFGVLVSVGLQKTKLAMILVYETFMIGVLGIFTGSIASIPLLYFLVYKPIPLKGQAEEMMIDMGFEPYMFFSIAPKVFTFQVLIIFIIVLVIAVYPFVKSLKLKENEAVRA